MKKLHEKSPCCRAPVSRFGEKRRQCTKCKKTWRVHKKKRGRKKNRVPKTLVVRFFDHALGSSRGRSLNSSFSTRTLERKVEQSRDLFSRTTEWPKIPEEGDLILVADGVLKRIDDSWYTIYCMLFRSVEGKEAVIFPPLLLFGKETQPGWKTALDGVPEDILSRTKAIVCDGHRGTVNYAKKKGWILQRCHYHLISSIQTRRSRFSFKRHGREGKDIWSLVYRVLNEKEEDGVTEALLSLQEFSRVTTSAYLKVILRGFVHNHKEFRAYLRHPELRLPVTSNTVESWNGCIEGLFHRMRGVRTPKKMEKWIEALAKYKKTIRCNGKYQPN